MTFPFSIDVNIPAANDNPAADQPIMQTNYANIAGFLAVDHVPAGTNQSSNKAAYHKQITFSKQSSTDYVPAAAPTDPLSIAFTAQANNAAFSGIVSNPSITQVQPFFWNANAPYLLNAVKAFGLLQLDITPLNPPGPGTLTILNGWNLHTLITPGNQIGAVAGRDFQVNVFNNSVTGNNISVFFMPQNPLSATPNIDIKGWSFTYPTLSFKLTGAVAGPFNMSLMILQV